MTKKEKNANDEAFVKACTAWDKGNAQTAFELFSRGANGGDVACQLNLGYFFDYGIYVKKDKVKAIHWYYQAYRQGDAGGANNIATIHGEGGCLGKMVWWFRRAVAMVDDEVWLELGKCYETGFGLPRNPMKAAACYHHILSSGNVSQLAAEKATRLLRRLRA